MKNARILKRALEDYSSSTSQRINQNKSLIYFMNANMDRQLKIKKIIGCEIGSFPGSYLGLPLGLAPLDNFWNSLIDKIYSKLTGWKGSLLSQASKVIVLKSIL